MTQVDCNLEMSTKIVDGDESFLVEVEELEALDVRIHFLVSQVRL